MPTLTPVRGEALIWYAVVGFASGYFTRAVYAIEDLFAHLLVQLNVDCGDRGSCEA
jgi:hypothetical protein